MTISKMYGTAVFKHYTAFFRENPYFLRLKKLLFPLFHVFYCKTGVAKHVENTRPRDRRI